MAYLLGITNINPLDYNLPFEMFAGKNYDREPDIDLNFSKEMQLKIFEDLEIEYGKDKVIWGGTIATLDETTIRQCCNEFKNEFELDNSFDVESISNKIRKIKRCTGEHPSGFFLLPQNIEILDICPTEIGERNHLITHCDHHSIDTPGSYRFDIIGNDAITMIDELEKETNIDSDNIKLDDDEILKMFLHANDNSYPFSTNGIPVFETDYAKKMIEVVKPNNFNDLVCISALYYGTDTWKYNADSLIKDEQKKVDEVISNREDMYNFLVNNGIEKDTAYDIVEFVRKGYANESRRLWIKDKERYWDLYKKWKEYVEILKKHKIPDWYIDSAAKIKYLFPKSHAIENTMNALKIAWYKINYPKAFYKIYFKRYPDFNVKEHYCKRQVETELNRIKDEEEIAKAKDYKKYSYPYENKKAVNLELVLEMFDRGILKEKEKIKDDYNLINSRAIGDYCRRIKYRLNTEELAVLVHRNKRMSIEEKIEKYYDLIKNYPDMEVIERINCEHYDSVKTLIKKEIKRLKKLSEELMQEEPDCIWVWNECGYDYGLNDIFNTYQATIKDLKQYKDDMKAFYITKKYLNKRKADIHAEYIIENQKIKLINITQFNNSLEDIDSIFVYLPTPFKKGDILINRRKSTRNIDEKDDIFVLDELYTWKNNIKQRLAKGNCDSSDMLAYGYYMSDYDGMEVTLDDIWEYDSFEYYDEELTGRDRFLKTISSLLKGEISIELFLYAYKLIDKDCSVHVTEWYSEEGKRLAGIDKIVK